VSAAPVCACLSYEGQNARCPLHGRPVPETPARRPVFRSPVSYIWAAALIGPIASQSLFHPTGWEDWAGLGVIGTLAAGVAHLAHAALSALGCWWILRRFGLI